MVRRPRRERPVAHPVRVLTGGPVLSSLISSQVKNIKLPREGVVQVRCFPAQCTWTMTAATALTIADTAAAAVMTAPMAHLRFALGPRLSAAHGTRQDDAPAGLGLTGASHAGTRRVSVACPAAHRPARSPRS